MVIDLMFLLVSFPQYEVQLQFANDSLCYITNLICLRHLPTKKERKIWHLQYTGWPDHGCPDDMYGFLGNVGFFQFSVCENQS